MPLEAEQQETANRSDAVTRPVYTSRLEPKTRCSAKVMDSSSPAASDATFMESGPDLADDMPGPHNFDQHVPAPSYEQQDASPQQQRPSASTQPPRTSSRGLSTPTAPQPISSEFGYHPGESELVQRASARATRSFAQDALSPNPRTPLPPHLRPPPFRSKTASPPPVRREGGRLRERSKPGPETWPQRVEPSPFALSIDFGMYKPTHETLPSTLPSTVTFYRDMDRWQGSRERNRAQTPDDRDEDDGERLAYRGSGDRRMQREAPVNHEADQYRSGYHTPRMSHVDNRNELRTRRQGSGGSGSSDAVNGRHSDLRGIGEMSEGWQGRAPQSISTSSFTLRSPTSAEAASRAHSRSEAENSTRRPIPRQTGLERRPVEPPTRRGSATPSFDAYAQASNNHATRATRPSTPFIGTTGSTNMCGREVNRPRRDDTLRHPLPALSFNECLAPGRLSRARVRPPSSISGPSEQPADTESDGQAGVDDNDEDDDDPQWDAVPRNELLEYAPYLRNKVARRTHFENKIQSLIQQFNELEEATGATFFVFASNPDRQDLKLVVSQGVLRHPEYVQFAEHASQSFARVAESRRMEKAGSPTLSQPPARSNGTRTDLSRLILSSMSSMSPAREGRTEASRSGWAAGDNTFSTGTSYRGSRNAVGGSGVAMPDQLRKLQAIDPHSMSAEQFRARVMATLAGTTAVQGQRRQYSQSQWQSDM
ncbi:hypothetical protein CALCODRAFT_314741 [Calocera cornea HHB12733]|uniref:Uncharacterized protein n=1 Tax=Calocera cornea HHB12733 TaxID=1353952 RepID=A0A165FC09_9BASI|nr:hypothetical protein CALCODRAFT_314741 [Calocera cornea HHB12733]